MHGRMRWGCLVPISAIWLFSCGGDSDDPSERLSQVGETCSKTGDCDSGLVCLGAVCQQEGAACPDDRECSGLECGSDPVCGTSCGTCSGDQSCSDGACVACIPSCGGKECGDDGCGGSCGECGGGGTCQDGQCSGASAGGTWKDRSSGLTWQNPPADDRMTWSEAKRYCSDLDGGSWRLPTIGELRSLIRGCPAMESGGTCNVEEGVCLAWSCRDDSCARCADYEGPANGCYWPESIQGDCDWYWSSSPVEDNDGYAWFVGFINGRVNDTGGVYDGPIFVRCVR